MLILSARIAQNVGKVRTGKTFKTQSIFNDMSCYVTVSTDSNEVFILDFTGTGMVLRKFYILGFFMNDNRGF